MSQLAEDSAREMVVGVGSDSHGLLRPQVLTALQGVDFIVHAGDVGGDDILPRLREIAPVAAVRGNVDHGPWASDLPETDVVTVGDAMLYVLHDVNALDLNPAAAGFHAVISGHSHRPSATWRDGILYLNPGSVGPRRFQLPISLARLRVRGTALQVEFVTLGARGGYGRRRDDASLPI